MLALAAASWLMAARTAPTRVQIVIGERADDPTVARTMTNAMGALRDGLASLAAHEPDALEVVPPRELLCARGSGAHCLALLDDLDRPLRLVVTPRPAPEG